MPERLPQNIPNSQENPEESSLPLHEKYPKLHISEEVKHSIERERLKTGERLHEPVEKLDAWMKDLEQIHIDRDPTVHERIKAVYHKKYVIRPNEIPESYFELQKKIAREQGHGDIDIPPQVKKEMSETISRDQERSLDAWIDYLSSSDATYPMWFKYYTFINITKLADFDKEKHEFKKRSKSTTSPFPDINREALAYMADSLAEQYGLSNNDTEIDPEIKALLDQDANFGKLYAHAIEKIHPATEEELSNIEGEWVKYNQGSEGTELAKTLQGHGTGWCTAGEGTAQAQLDMGDFYVYYTKDQQGEYQVPRVAIRMQEGKMAEVRGIQVDQNLEPALVDIAKEKMEELPGAKEYEKKTEDMQTLTLIEKKVVKGEELNSQDLRFLYEIDSTIEGFGYQRDPRIKELFSQRNPETDMPILFECDQSQIARNLNEITENTKAYVGPLIPGIFNQLENVEHIYTRFPENRIRRESLEIGGKTTEQLEEEIKKAGMKIYDYAKQMMHNPDFITSEKAENLTLVKLKVSDLLPGNPTTDELYKKAKELGLELCPAEAGPNYRLKYTNQPMDEYEYIGMKQITDSNGSPSVFYVVRYAGGPWLNADSARPTRQWRGGYRMVFSLRKLES